MLERHVVQQLTAYCHHELTAAESSRVQQHLERCESCRQEYEDIRLAVDLAGRMTLQRAPDSLWEDVVQALDGSPSALKSASLSPVRRAMPRWAFAVASLLLVTLVGTGWYYWRLNRPSWEVARLEGKPKVGWSTLGETGRIAVGDWLETDRSSRALISVGDIGEVEVDPNTRVRLVRARETELGCMYTLEVGPDGIGRLNVTFGWVAFELNGRESFVPADATCETRPSIGPGTPHYEDASAELISSLRRFDFENGGNSELAIVLSHARKEDAFTLWHLLARTVGVARSNVYDRLASLVPAPDGVTREGILRLERDMLDLWWNALGLDDASWWRIWKGPVPQGPQ
jgi:anti-sigma factor RsiW